jgi:2-keto-3-deoxy-L-rhamnonate aldolase RhmA
MPDPLKQRLANGEQVNLFMAGPLASPKLLEAIGMTGAFDGVWIDQEHLAIPQSELELLLMGARAGDLDVLVRVAPTDYTAVMRPYETGANGVMAAQIRTVDEVQQIVSWANYPPVGTRGLFGRNWEGGYGHTPPAEQVAGAHRDTWLAIQIETAEAVEYVDEIAAIEGVDHLFVGPGDLACTLGVTGDAMHPKCLDALQRVAAAAKASGKSWGALNPNKEHAEYCLKLGCQLFSIGSDIDLVYRGIKATQGMFGEVY